MPFHGWELEFTHFAGIQYFEQSVEPRYFESSREIKYTVGARLFEPGYFEFQNHFPWFCPSVIYYRLFQAPAISN